MTTTPAMSDEEERAAFQEWYKESRGGICLRERGSIHYISHETQLAWAAYQQGRANERTRQAALAGEPSEEDIERVAKAIYLCWLPCDTEQDFYKSDGNRCVAMRLAKAAILSYLKKE